MDINIASAKPKLSELVERAEKGELIRIARRGKPVVELRPVAQPKAAKPFDWAGLQDELDAQPMWTPPAGFEGLSFVEYLRRTNQI